MISKEEKIVSQVLKFRKKFKCNYAKKYINIKAKINKMNRNKCAKYS